MEDMNQKLKLDFLKRVLTDTVPDDIIRENFFITGNFPTDSEMKMVCEAEVPPKRLTGMDWPEKAHTMIGIKRLNNLHDTLDYIRNNSIDGDFIETGVWRGGASIFIKFYNDLYEMNRKVFVSDSFEGLPAPDVEKYPVDTGDTHHKIDYLKVSLEEVVSNFSSYRVLDKNVVFLKGWFKDTLSDPRIEKLAILRFDGDMYGSTMDVFNQLYHKVVSKGIVIVDDFCLPNCVRAVNDFRQAHDIKETIMGVDFCGVYWVKN